MNRSLSHSLAVLSRWCFIAAIGDAALVAVPAAHAALSFGGETWETAAIQGTNYHGNYGQPQQFTSHTLVGAAGAEVQSWYGLNASMYFASGFEVGDVIEYDYTLTNNTVSILQGGDFVGGHGGVFVDTAAPGGGVEVTQRHPNAVSRLDLASGVHVEWTLNDLDYTVVTTRLLDSSVLTAMTTAYSGGLGLSDIVAFRLLLINTEQKVTIANFVFDTSFVPGDVNGDSVANEFDYFIIRDHFRNTNAAPGDGDLTGDGVVDFVDYRQWYTAATPAAIAVAFASSNAVPEPTGVALAVVGAVAFIMSRRHRAKEESFLPLGER